MPTARTGRDIRQNPVYWKNSLRSAAEQLRAFGVASSKIAEMLDEPHRLAEDSSWWEQQSDGLAAFSSPDQFTRYRLPLEFEPRVVVDRQFSVKQLLPVLEGDGKFYILAVSQNEVRLVEATRHSASELDRRGLPENLRDALDIDEYVASLQHHSTERGSLGREWGMFHGHGGSDRDVEKKDEIVEYFRLINKAIEDFLREERAPLVFAGVEHLFPIFQETCSYSRLVDKPVAGNPEPSSAGDLQQKAWPLVALLFSSDRAAALERYGAALPRKLAGCELQKVLQAARDGRVDTLFVARGAEVWGEIDDTPAELRITQTEQGPEAKDLADYAVLHALLTGATVYTVEPEEMPSHAPLAALFRYPV
jgi:hypothetical protein